MEVAFLEFRIILLPISLILLLIGLFSPRTETLIEALASILGFAWAIWEFQIKLP